ncbi:MAG: LysM peptidoglycan-binding domain-containing protein [Balneolaceae bacterium]|nr:MAG: LysM peptidoglycan-binding domain-containing protein [Balneolaceae bacterium]
MTHSLLKSLLFIIFSGLFTVLTMESATAQTTEIEHIVRQGETLFSISREYDVTVGELREWNNLQSDDLRPGQVLILRPLNREGSITHRVQAGESLFAISREYGVTIAEIQQWNNLSGTSLEAGRELVIFLPDEETGQTAPPSVEEIEQMDEEERTSIVRSTRQAASGSDTYTVRSGDTLTQIARNHDMTVAELRSMNNLQGDMLRVGQRLTVRRIQTAPSVVEGAKNSTPQGRFALHRLQTGENINTILNRFRMSEAELQALNPDINVRNASSGQQLTVLLPPTRNFPNPFRSDANLENLGTVPVTQYGDNDRAVPTTSGELYNPTQLTAAHSNMALGNIIYIENPSNGIGIFVRVNDRYSGDGLKLSHRAFSMLGFSAVEQPMVTIFLDD